MVKTLKITKIREAIPKSGLKMFINIGAEFLRIFFKSVLEVEFLKLFFEAIKWDY